MGPRRLTALVATAAVVAGCSAPSQPEPAPTESGEARIGRVGDGDSVRLADGREVRLLQIDAPELHPDCFGTDARRELERLLPRNAVVRLEADPRLDDHDRYHRLLRYVHRGGLNVNLELVERGAASPYFFREDRGRYAGDLLSAAKSARAGGRGFWSACPRAELSPRLGSVTGPVASQRG